MAKGAPTEAATNFGMTAMPDLKPLPAAAGASMTKAPAGTPEGQGWIGDPGNLPSGVTGEWVPYTAPPLATPLTPAPATRASLAGEMNKHTGRGAASHGDRQGATTSGSGWGGNSSAGSGYGMGGRERGGR